MGKGHELAILKKNKIKNSKKEITKKFNYSTSHKNMF